MMSRRDAYRSWKRAAKRSERAFRARDIPEGGSNAVLWHAHFKALVAESVCRERCFKVGVPRGAHVPFSWHLKLPL